MSVFEPVRWIAEINGVKYIAKILLSGRFRLFRIEETTDGYYREWDLGVVQSLTEAEKMATGGAESDHADNS